MYLSLLCYLMSCFLGASLSIQNYDVLVLFPIIGILSLSLFLVGRLKSSLRQFYGSSHDVDNHNRISTSEMTLCFICHNHNHYSISTSEMTSCSICHNPNPVHYSLVTWFITRVRRRMPLVEREQLIHPDHLSSYPIVRGVRFAQSLVFLVFIVL